MNGIAYAAIEIPSLVEVGAEIVDNVCKCAQTVIESLKSFPIYSTGNTTSLVLTSTATVIATLLVVIELCSQAMGFHFEDVNEAVRFGLKVVVYKIIIENSSKIVKMVYDMFLSDKSWDDVKAGFGTIQSKMTDAAKEMKAGYDAYTDTSFLGIEKVFIGIVFLIVSIVIVVLCVNIIASIAGLIFELCINIAIAPVPIATLVNSQTRSIGINFIKSFAGNCLTLTMYGICFTIYKLLSDNIQTAFETLLSGGTGFSPLSIAAGSLVGVLLLSVAIKNVSSMISKVLS